MVADYSVVAGAPLPDCAPIVVQDQVLFGSGSAQLRDGFEPLPGLAVRLLELNPSVEITVVTHTDSVAGDAFKQGLSEARAEAIGQWKLEQGADPDRLFQMGGGESDPVALTTQPRAGPRIVGRNSRFATLPIFSLVGSISVCWWAGSALEFDASRDAFKWFSEADDQAIPGFGIPAT